MAESGSGQEKTEQATPKKLLDARREGQIPRSRELTTIIVLMISGIALLLLGDSLIDDLKEILRLNFVLSRQDIFDSSESIRKLADAIETGLVALLPFFLIISVAAIVAPAALGGWSFSLKSLALKLDRLDPVSGMKRVFSWNGIAELLKALIKFLLVSTVGYLLLEAKLGSFASLSRLEITTALDTLGDELTWIFIILCSPLVLVSALDVPFQLWNFQKQQRMTMQEVKDEHKETEGNPEIKGKTRAMQREIAQRRMMEDVPTADVVITNPTHYAVALRYEQMKHSAPIAVAIGKDLVALQIRRIAAANDVPIVEAPPLARALYYHSDLGKEIPAGLYLAVAQVLAYIYQLKQYQSYGGKKPTPLKDIPVPDDLRED